jgi:hypothetical protein
MVQGDDDWRRWADTIRAEDLVAAGAYNASSSLDFRLELGLGPVPWAGAIATAPVVLLLSHPAHSPVSSDEDYTQAWPGWPLSALHPEAPLAPSAWWRSRVAALVDLFGAQHVSNSVAALFLTPWQCARFDERLRLPSRRRMLALAAAAAARDALMLVVHGMYLWTEQPEIASLPTTRRIHPRSRSRTEITPANLGDAWSTVCKRIELHAW